MDHHADSLAHIALILAATFIGGAVFRRLNQPVLVGYIIVGLILGPSVLGYVDNSAEVGLLAELGILLLLFIVGVELDLSSFKAVSRVSIITCACQIALGLIFMGGLGYAFGWPLNLCILLGFAVSLSSTAVTLKLLQDRNLLKSNVGKHAIGILIAQDMAVIPMILIIGALNTSEGFNYVGLLRLGVAVFLLVGMMYLFQKKPRMFTKIWVKFEHLKRTAMKGQATLTAIAICFTASALAGILGVSPAYGAFLAGTAVGNTATRMELKDSVEPLFDITIMVFFLSIGLLIDFKFLMENWVAAISLLFLTMLLKTVFNVAILRSLGMNKADSYQTGSVLAQVGEFSFILASMGLIAGTIDGDGHKYVVAIISLSLLATPLWLYLVDHFVVVHDNVQAQIKSNRNRVKKP